MADRYVNLEHPHRPGEPSSFFMVNALLKARITLGMESNKPYFDEDVNVYLMHLLNDLIFPERIERRSRWVRHRDSEVAELLGRASRRRRYEIYRANADDIVLRHAVFRCRPSGNRPPRYYDRSLRHELGRARMYYRFAADLAPDVPGARGVGVVLAKLARDLDRYIVIIRHASAEHMRITAAITDGSLYHLMRRVNAVGNREAIAEMRDQFLDLYGEYLQSRHPRPALKEEINSVIDELTALDPDFSFSPLR